MPIYQEITKQSIRINLFILWLNRKSRGFGFVEFADKEDVEVAMKELKGVYIKGREIGVEIAKHKRKTRDEYIVFYYYIY